MKCAVDDCFRCDGNNETCASCKGGFSLAKNESGVFCLPCHDDCMDCDPGKGRNFCKTCRPGFAKVNGPTLPGPGPDDTNCVQCPKDCRTCSADKPDQCVECSLG